MQARGRCADQPTPAPLHAPPPRRRLDTISSGALALATSREAAGELVAAFRRRAVAKFYVAISDRKPAKKMGSVVGDMAKGRRGSWLLQRSAANPCVTRFTSAAVPGGRPGLRAFLLKPETGRTHQLRVALKSLGAPVLGDQVQRRVEARLLRAGGAAAARGAGRRAAGVAASRPHRH